MASTPKMNRTSPASSHPSSFQLCVKSVSPSIRIWPNPALRHRSIDLSRYTSACSWLGRLPERLTRYNGSLVLANEISSGW